MSAAAPEGYDPHAFEPFAVTVDLAVFTVRDSRLHVLLVERGEEPYKGHWALPGGFLLPRESAGDAARRELAEETGLSDDTVSGLHLEQLRTYSDPDRDPRMRVVSVAHTALVPDLPEPRGGATRRAPGGGTPPGRAPSPSTTTASSRTPATGSAPSSNTPAWPPRSARPTSPSASCNRSTRRSGASSWTAPTSAARSSRPRASSSPPKAPPPHRRPGQTRRPVPRGRRHRTPPPLLRPEGRHA